jgi:iron complex transport system substrate-binding protein
MNKLTKAGIAGFLFALTASIAGCGSSASTSDTTIAAEEKLAAPTYPVTVGELTLAAQPMRIISLSPTSTEMLYAIGAGAQVVAVDEYSNYPAEAVALGTMLSGFEPNIEAISGFTPDLVIASYDPGSLAEQLGSLNIPLFIANAPTSLDSVYEQIEQLGMLVGHVAEADQLVATMQTEIAAAVSAVVAPATPLSYYYELDDTYFSVTSNSFIGQLFNLFGLRNIADNAEAGNDYPQLSAEAIVSSNPDIIVLADTKCCAQTAETVAARDGWGGLNAVVAGNIAELDDDIASRWGPRIVELIVAIGEAVTKASAK